MDVRTLFLAQTGAFAATAVMLWLARAEADERSGLGTWTWAVTAQGLGYLLLANAGRLPAWVPAWLPAFGGNLLGSTAVALFFVAIRRFLRLPWRRWPLVSMVVLVTAVGAWAGATYQIATIFNGYVYGLVQLLNGWALLRIRTPAWHRVQRVVALFYLVMGLVLPLRATGLALQGTGVDYLEHPLAWQEPIYAFGFLFVIVTNLGFLLMCKSRAEADVRLQAMTDELTGLSNRRALDLAIAQALQAGRPFAVAMVDVDHFKRINDDFGHSAGDAVLAEFANRLRAAVGPQDLPFRYGGEEFSVLLPELDLTGAMVVAEHVRQQVARPASPDGLHPVTASLGIAAWEPGDTADTLLRRADQGLYQAKSLGRNRVEAG
jgi:diguanylate cyclase (GGDEF)-like protein